MTAVHCDHMFIDAKSIVTQAFFQGQRASRSGVTGLIETIIAGKRLLAPKNICLFWSGGVSKSKERLCPSYALKREISRAEADIGSLEREINLAKKILSTCHVIQISIDGIEACDAMGYLSTAIQESKVIVSASRQYFQLLSEDTKIFDPKRNLLISETEGSLILGFPTKYYLLWKSIVGDSSRGILGIGRIGKVKAKRLIASVIARGRKFPIQPHEQAAIDRNKYLFALGAMLTEEEKSSLIGAYLRESEKSLKRLHGKGQRGTYS